MAFIILSISTLLLYPITQSIFKTYRNLGKKVYCTLMCMIFIFFIGFRSMNIGTDSRGYAIDFLNAPHLNWGFIIKCFTRKESLFYLFQSVIRSITDSYSIWFLIIAIIYMIPVCRYIYKYSDYPFISFIMFMSMGFMNFAMAGLRQILAASFLIISFDYLLKNKYIKSIIFITLASFFHITSLIFLISIFISKKMIKFKDIILLVCTIIFTIVFGKRLITIIVEFVFADTRDYGVGEFGGYSTFILLNIIAILAIIFNKNISSKKIGTNNYDAYFYKYLLIAIPFQLLAIYQANFFRIAMYFSFFGLLIVIPKTLSIQKDKGIRILGVMLVLVLMLIQLFVFTYHINDVNPYEFFWQV